MSDLDIIKKDLLYLAFQLEKLHKVINHSDPSADSKKKVLYDKYKKSMIECSQALKDNYSWDNIKSFLQVIENDPLINIEKERLRSIFKKLISDLEQQIIEKPVVEEFTMPDPAAIRKMPRPTVKIRKIVVKEEPKPFSEPPKPVKKFTRENLMDMVDQNQRKKKAATSLKLLIEAINKIGPESLEEKIIKSVKPK